MTTESEHHSERVSVVITIITCGLHIWLLYVAKEFTDVFKDFGAELPFYTTLFLPGSSIYYLLPLGAIIVLIGQHLRLFPTKLAFSVIGISTGLFTPAFIIAMYLPIFQLGAVVTSQ
jgi:type II secretory pathway component PulF